MWPFSAIFAGLGIDVLVDVRAEYVEKGDRMGRIVITEYISVDGVVEAPSGTEDFERVGWTDDFSRGPEGDAF